MNTLFTYRIFLAFSFFLSISSFAQLPFSENFESGNLTTNGWVVSGNAQVSNQNPASGNYCLKGPTNWGISKKFNQGSMNFVGIQFKTRASQTNTTCVIFRIIDSLMHTAAGMFFKDDGNIIAVNGTTSVSIMPYDTGKWYAFNFIMDMNARTYDMYINGQLKADNFNFSSSQFTTVNNFTWSSIATSGINWVDDIGILPNVNGINEPRAINALHLYPNPAIDHINFDLHENETYRAFVFNATGQIVYETIINDFNGCINLSNLNSGIYLLKLFKPEENKAAYTGRFMKL